MENKTLLVLILVIAFILFGPPDVLNLGIFQWDLKNNPQNEQQISSTTSSSVYAKDAVSIEKLRLDKSIYSKGENISVFFTINNKFDLSYNFTVYWINDKERKEGWTTKNFTNDYRSWLPIDKEGEWKIQVDLYWIYENITYTTDDIIEFSVY